MCSLDVSFIKYKYVKCCSVRMRLCLIRICVHFLFRTASWGDAPNWPYSYSIRVIGHVCACSVLLHSKCPVQSHVLYRWRAAVGTFRPTETAARWQSPTHLGNPLCMSHVGLSYTRTHCSYLCSIQIVLKFIYILLYNAVIIIRLFWMHVCLFYLTSNLIKLVTLFMSQCCWSLLVTIYSNCLTAQAYAGQHSTHVPATVCSTADTKQIITTVCTTAQYTHVLPCTTVYWCDRHCADPTLATTELERLHGSSLVVNWTSCGQVGGQSSYLVQDWWSVVQHQTQDPPQEEWSWWSCQCKCGIVFVLWRLR